MGAAAELVSEATREYISTHEEDLPLISTACPSVVRLIRVRFPNLIPHLLPLNPPVEVAASLGAAEGDGKDRPAKREDRHLLYFSVPVKSDLCKGSIGYGKERDRLRDGDQGYLPSPAFLYESSRRRAGGNRHLRKDRRKLGQDRREAGGLFTESYLAADGIENVIRVLEDLEDQKFSQLQFVELNACSGGCVGGVLTVENPYVSAVKLNV